MTEEGRHNDEVSQCGGMTITAIRDHLKRAGDKCGLLIMSDKIVIVRLVDVESLRAGCFWLCDAGLKDEATVFDWLAWKAREPKV